MVEDAKKERHRRDQNALQAAHVGQNIQNRVATPLDVHLVQTHVDQNPLHQVLLEMARLYACFLESEHA